MNRRTFLTNAAAAGTLALWSEPSSEAAPQPAALGDVQLLVFDTFGTVVDWRSAVIAEGQALGKAKRLAVDWPAFADAWRAGYAPAMNRVRSGELPWTRLDVLHRMTLETLLTQFKITGLSDSDVAHFNRVWHRLKGWPDSVDGLTRLRKKFILAPLSNGNVSLLTEMAKFAGLPWDVILSTELVRHYKPDRETYLMPGELFDLPPAQVMMVAAHIGDLQAAKALGLRTAYVHRPLEYGAGRATTPPADGTFDLQVGDLRALAGALGT